MQKKILQWAYVLMVASISLLIWIAVLIFAWHAEDATPWTDMKAADWGVWAGSIGTVATLIGTIILATTDKRRTRREAQDRAVVAAAALGPKLFSLQLILVNFSEILLDERFEKTQFQYSSMVSGLNSKPLWTNDDILPLIVLPHHVCTRLAGVRTLLEQLISDMKDLADTWDYSFVQEQMGPRQGKIAGNMVACRDIVSFAAEECKKTLHHALHV